MTAENKSMTKDTSAVETPPRRHNADGETRLVGVEIEFANVDVGRTASIVCDLYGGEQDIKSPHHVSVRDTSLGDFEIELDWQGAHKANTADEAYRFADVEGRVREALGHAVTDLVPAEVVCPPIPWDRLGELRALFDELREFGAEGTDERLLYGFGLHLNPEVAEVSTDYAFRNLQAYVILEEWLRETINIDVTRRMLPHINSFPDRYLRLLSCDSYSPDMKTLIHDYTTENQTRNRGLDMMPLFRHLDEATLLASFKDANLVKARPTFHYRLPNAQLSDANWDAVVEWNRWVEVEKLAEDMNRLAVCREAFAQWLAKPASERWLDTVKNWFQ